MGATYIEVAFTGDPKAMFERVHAQAVIESGTLYSGDWGVVPGVEVRNEELFANRDAASDWLQDMANKWQPALAVRFQRGPDAANAIREAWLMGAWASS